ncbi:hypothetical protein BDY21DRAFT_362514 [Lineolata rhizophorae]|uniref:Small secreted protein n=1 Tax=Lineolata rhizophorae TaxID=578093 RepID=A0A6A6P4U9_9PEZI|nr:hypothetical protein BDY21DRAFT_362514 [Lineolata rhizophorae]
MKCAHFTLLLGLAAAVTSLPHAHRKRALEERPYSEFQISDGVAGNAQAEVFEQFPIDTSDLASVSASDLDIIKSARETAEAAEVDAGGFNEAIDAAGGADSAEGAPLQTGKIKNKVLKLQLEVLALQIEQAQGDDGVAEKLDEEQAKLDTNVALDEEAAGQPSQSVDFDG